MTDPAKLPLLPSSRIVLLTGVAALGLLGCTVAPVPPPAVVQAEALPGVPALPASWTNPASAAAVSTGWVASFHDRTLSALVAEALANNPDLKIAAARVAEAQQGLIIAGSPLFPAVGAEVGADHSRNASTDETFDRSGGTLSVLWEVDVWGQISSGKAAAAAQYEAAAQNEAFARMSIAALVARAWYTNVGLVESIALTKTQVANFTEQTDIVRKKNAAGEVDMMDVDLAEATLAAAEADLTELEARADTAIRSLEVLLGRYPGKDLQARSGFPALPGRVPAGTPAALISRRPDVVAAARQVDAAFYDVQVAQLALLPRFTLTGDAGRLDDGALAVLGLAPNYLQVGASLLQPIFAGGALNADIASASARQQAAVASYGKTMLAAFREVETSLANDGYYRKRLGQLQTETAEWADAVKLAEDKFNAGQIDMQSLLQMQERLEATQQQVIEAEAGVILNRIDLYLALGGGL